MKFYVDEEDEFWNKFPSIENRISKYSYSGIELTKLINKFCVDKKHIEDMIKSMPLIYKDGIIYIDVNKLLELLECGRYRK